MEFVFGKQDLADQARAQESCFLLTNGLGGYCSLSAGWSATRGDHALLMACLHAPTLRCNMVHRVGEVLEAAGRRVPLSTQDLAGRPAEEGWRQLVTFTAGAVPCWVYEAAGVRVTREVAMARGANTVAVRYTVENHSGAPCTLRLTPWFCFVPKGGRLTRRRAFTLGDHWLESGGLRLYFAADARLVPFPTRFESLYYRQDAPDGRRATGLCAANHELVLTVADGRTRRSSLVYGMEPDLPAAGALLNAQRVRVQAQARACGLRDPLARRLSAAADAFLVRRASTDGMTILAGYPFFTDWGRDTMIALPGCALTTRRYGDARSILQTFLAHERDGLMPNLFPDHDAPPQYNTVDAALLFFNCVWLYHRQTGDDAFVREAWDTMARILHRYRTGTRHGIHADADGLLCAGEGLDQVTWMDVRIGTHLPTPRHGKPVEVNAYWYNALRIAARLAPLAGQDGAGYDRLADQAGAAFREKFFMPEAGCLRDVLSDPPCRADSQLRCNQIWAVSMPFTPLTRAQAAAVVATVRRELYTPCGLRTLAPGDPDFHPVYGGPQAVRDLAYHQGTVWPFPLGGYWLAVLRTAGFAPEARAAVRRDLDALAPALREGCIGSLPEIYDGGSPGPSRGCYAQAWSVGEVLRVLEALERPEAAGFAGGWADAATADCTRQGE